MLSVICLIFALVLFVVAALLNPPEQPWRSKLALLGLACWVLGEILRSAPPLLGR